VEIKQGSESIVSDWFIIVCNLIHMTWLKTDCSLLSDLEPWPAMSIFMYFIIDISVLVREA